MKIKVKSLQGDEYNVDVHNEQLVTDLKAFISVKANGLAIERQKLVYKGRTMQDANVVGDYNLEEGCKVHLILQKESNLLPQSSVQSAVSTPCPMDTSSRLQSDINKSTTEQAEQTGNQATIRPQSRFEIILRERLAEHFAPNAVEKIMANLQHEINADVNSSSLDDLERLAKQKLNISNE